MSCDKGKGGGVLSILEHGTLPRVVISERLNSQICLPSPNILCTVCVVFFPDFLYVRGVVCLLKIRSGWREYVVFFQDIAHDEIQMLLCGCATCTYLCVFALSVLLLLSDVLLVQSFFHLFIFSKWWRACVFFFSFSFVTTIEQPV